LIGSQLRNPQRFIPPTVSGYGKKDPNQRNEPNKMTIFVKMKIL
jgi:hypothetical protein